MFLAAIAKLPAITPPQIQAIFKPAVASFCASLNPAVAVPAIIRPLNCHEALKG